MSKNRGKELRKIQKELVDEILTNPEGLQRIINIQLAGRVGFHQYSLNNILLANWELWSRTGEGAELLAPYKKWADVNRHVKKGEKAIYILAPIHKKIKEATEDRPAEYITWFKSVPVFDLSQTEGEPLEVDFTHSNLEWTLEEVTSRINVPVKLSHKQLTRGSTDGETIKISKHLSVEHQICTYFHELAHYLLHFDENREELDTPTKELEAEAISYLVSCYIGIENKEAPAYIHNWTSSISEDKKKELLKGKGSNVLKTATKIIDDLKLNELLDSKTTIITSNPNEIEVKA